MSGKDVLQAKGRNTKTKEKSCRKPIVVGIVLALCVSLLAGAFWVGNFGSANDAHAQFASITTFGLAPADAEKAELLSEHVVFDESETGEFHVTMTYRVNLLEKTSFLLPYAHLAQYENPEIDIDGSPIDFTSERLNCVVQRPMVYPGAKLQSVGFSDSDLQESQPLDSFRLLMDSLNSYGGKRHILSQSSKLKVFELSHAETEGEDGKIQFEVEGNLDTVRLMFADGACEYIGHDNQLQDDGVLTQYRFRALDSSSDRKWFAVPQSSEVTVRVGDEQVLGEILEMETVLTQMLGVNSEEQSAYLKSLNRSLEETALDGTIFIANPHLTAEDTPSVQSSPFASLYRFDVEKSGIHEITVRLKATGSSFNYMLEWADSPDIMWRQAGERRLYVHLREKPYQYMYHITDDLIHFEESGANE